MFSYANERIFNPKTIAEAYGLVGVTETSHTFLDNKEVVRLSEDEHVGGGDRGAVHKLELYVVDTGHVKGRGWLPCSSAGGEGEHVHEPGRGVGPLADGLDLTEE